MTGAIETRDPLWIPLPDGRRLAATLWRPAGSGPVPAILEYLPYRRRDGTAPRDATTHPVFAASGYACVRVDLAGSGDSDGLFDDEYSEQELSDGEAVIAWIAAQEWCDGAVGMIGISWGGFNGLQLAYRRPPALKAVVSVCSTVDRYADDIHFMGGCLLTDNFNWGGQMHAYMSRPPDPAIRDDWRDVWIARLEALPFSAVEWLRHASRDAFWRHGSICEDWHAIEAPVLALGGWADAYVNAPFALAEHLDAPVSALTGPWEHKYPHIAKTNPADFHGEILGWFDRWLKGHTPPPLPAMRAFITAFDAPETEYHARSGRWVAEAEWPSANIAARRLYLSPGALGEVPGKGTATVSSAQTVGQASAYFCPGMRVDNELAPDQSPDDALSVCFETAPLGESLELLGRPVLRIAFTVDRPAAFLCARLCDVAPDGTSRRISYRPLNLCHRDGFEAAEPLVPGERYGAVIELNACGHRFAAGNRLRLALSTAYWPVIWPSPDSATVTLALDGCSLDLPERRVREEIEPAAPAAPRAFPILDADVLRPASSETERETRDDGTLVLRTADDFGATRNPDHGIIEGSSVVQRFAIHPDDPLGAEHWAQWEYTFARGDWSVRIVTENRMTADASSFCLWRRTTAFEGEADVFDRVQEERVPRVFL